MLGSSVLKMSALTAGSNWCNLQQQHGRKLEQQQAKAAACSQHQLDV
jgi:hypothetical protein